MWHILKAEFASHKYLLAICFFVPLTLLFMSWQNVEDMKSFSNPPHPSVKADATQTEQFINAKEGIKSQLAHQAVFYHLDLSATLILFAIFISALTKAKQSRLLLHLPLSPIKIGISRTILWLIMYGVCIGSVILTALALSSYYQRPFTGWFVFSILDTNSYTLCAIPLCWIALDLSRSYLRHVGAIGQNTLFIVALILSFIVAVFMGLNLIMLFKTNLGWSEPLILHLMAVLLLALSIYTFKHRRSYLR